MYYIEEDDKLSNGFRKVFPRVRLKENKILISGISEQLGEKKSIKLAQKTDKILRKTKSNKIVLSKLLQDNEVYRNMLYTYGYEIVDGKWLYEGLSIMLLDYIIDKKQLKKEECQVSVLVNDLKDYTLQSIKLIAKEYKTLNIVTNHLEKFKKIEQNILDESGLVITVTNNKKKSLVKSNIILNIDFPKELLNKYNVFDEAIIINICGNLKLNKKRFNGLIINNYDINVKDHILTDAVGTSLPKYYVKQIYEAEFFKNMTYSDFIKKLKNDKCKIDKLYSINGVL